MKTVVWDVDDVLNDFTRRWFEDAWLPAHAACRVTYGGLTENPPHRLLGVELPEYLAALDAYRLSPAVAALPPSPEVAAWFAAKGGACHHIALTARPLASAPAAAAWVFNHFGRWIRGFHFVPSERAGETAPRYDSTKAEVLRRIGTVDAFLDDSAENVAATSKLGIPAVLVPRPWNGGDDPGRALSRLDEILAL